MRFKILLHSTTGNTRLIARHTLYYAESKGHHCEIVDLVRHPEPPDLAEVDCLVVACPTMYFRPTFAMEGYLTRIPNLPPGEKKPAFLLATCGGEPGAQFAIEAEILAHKGYVTLGAHWVLAPPNWPTHLQYLEHLQWTRPLGRMLHQIAQKTPYELEIRTVLGFLWPEAAESNHQDCQKLEAFLERMLQQASSGDLSQAPTPGKLHHGIPSTQTLGRITTLENLSSNLHLKIEPSRCSNCGTCVRLCPVGVIRQPHEEAPPVIGEGCTICWACFNNCPDGAISASGTTAGKGQYKGPSSNMRQVFRTATTSTEEI